MVWNPTGAPPQTRTLPDGRSYPVNNFMGGATPPAQRAPIAGGGYSPTAGSGGLNIPAPPGGWENYQPSLPGPNTHVAVNNFRATPYTGGVPGSISQSYVPPTGQRQKGEMRSGESYVDGQEGKGTAMERQAEWARRNQHLAPAPAGANYNLDPNYQFNAVEQQRLDPYARRDQQFAAWQNPTPVGQPTTTGWSTNGGDGRFMPAAGSNAIGPPSGMGPESYGSATEYEMKNGQPQTFNQTPQAMPQSSQQYTGGSTQSATQPSQTQYSSQSGPQTFRSSGGSVQRTSQTTRNGVAGPMQSSSQQFGAQMPDWFSQLFSGGGQQDVRTQPPTMSQFTRASVGPWGRTNPAPSGSGQTSAPQGQPLPPPAGGGVVNPGGLSPQGQQVFNAQAGNRAMGMSPFDNAWSGGRTTPSARPAPPPLRPGQYRLPSGGRAYTDSAFN